MIQQYSTLLLQLYRHAQALPVDKFQDATLELVRPHVHFDSSMWGTATMMEDGIDIHSVHLYNSSPAMLKEYQKIKHFDTAAMRVTAQPTLTLGFHVEDFPGDANREFRQFLHDFGHRNFLITSDINPVTRFVQWVSLYRKDLDARCTGTDIDLLACLAPHLMQALALNRLVHLDGLVRDAAREKWCVAIADIKGVIYHADDRFKRLVLAARTLADLPSALLQKLLAPSASIACIAYADVVIQSNRQGEILFLKARARESVDALSDREFLVACLIARGLSQKQVAARLDRSPETIRTQVKAIFAKLSISNIATLGMMLAVRDIK